ncbi:Selection and upkeep of intraepithelial T-cells protein 7 [Galemys pyrenaicus]|uniref:Selection and upkeep of intraepithelial T-cells protein 7 n=1 Tax=Galemys pyrenaicus TaxID=202257 RepID=A0A8J5ZH36_GALPY|nr:Selection and upkeep of intraepithelial T-cells protein 7 [Galemys pyrenaicus]
MQKDLDRISSGLWSSHMVKPKSSSFNRYCVGFLLLRVMASTSEKWTVTIPKAHLVALVGGQAELSFQSSLPQSAKHMEVCWFRSNHSKPVYLYRDGREVSAEAALEYVDHTEFVKEAIEEGKVTLRLHNVSAAADGLYECSFKGGEFSDLTGMNLTVTGLETQIQVHTPGPRGIMVECSSGGGSHNPGWSGETDKARLCHMKMTLLPRNHSQGNMTCYIYNLVTGEGRQTSIILTAVHPQFHKPAVSKPFPGVVLASSTSDVGTFPKLQRQSSSDQPPPSPGWHCPSISANTA